ncbi:hypothetical protein [Roseobacter sp. SK209-2-6]|uniref:hypothetical protein n=1 Tax=Roseobacter sp. SK209-2-6 TaxID=388739 RepID=UPI00056C52F6|nr:hypothetical protein [Roseobacter sp. SK209-2-6]
MPFLLGALGLIAAAYFWAMRARNAAEMTHELLDVANDVRLAARRFGFRRRHNLHPVDTIDDAAIAIAAIGSCLLELDDYPTAEQKEALIRGLRDAQGISHEAAEELVILGRWITNESGGPAQAVSRLAKRLYKLNGAEDLETIAKIATSIAKFGNGALSEKQKTALEDLQRGLKVS